MEDERPKRRKSIQFGLKRLLLWTAILAGLLSVMRMMEFWVSDYAITLGGIVILFVARLTFRPRRALSLWVVVVGLFGVFLALRFLMQLADAYSLSPREIKLNMVWLSLLGFGFGSVAGLITYGAAELACQLVDCLDERMQSGDRS